MSSGIAAVCLVALSVLSTTCNGRLRPSPDLEWGAATAPAELLGGNTGDAVESSCGPGAALVGFYGTHGAMVFGLGALCGRISIEAATLEAPARIRVIPDSRQAMFGNNVAPPPPPYEFRCRPDAVIVSVEIEAKKFMFPTGEAGPFVSYARASCSRLNLEYRGGSPIVAFYPDTTLDPIGQAAGGSRRHARCPEGAVATQFDGRAGAYIDALGIRCTPLMVAVAPAIWQNSRAFTPIVAGVIISLYLLLGAAVRGSTSRARWLPALTFTAASAGAMLDGVATDFGLDRPLFAVCLVLGFGVVSTLAVPFPSLVLSLGNVPPVHTLLPLMLRSHRVRRRVFSGYLDRLRLRLAREMGDANQERYVELEATVLNRMGELAIERPSAGVLDFLTMRRDADVPPTVLIEAGGGRGKSALLRRILTLYIERFLEGAEIPVPVWCDPHAGTWNEIVLESLGSYSLSPEAFQSMMQAGDFMLFADGVSESSSTPEMLRTFRSSSAGQYTGMLLASRPNQALSAVVRDFADWDIVVPSPVSERQLAQFAEEYLRADRHPLSDLDQVLRVIRATCRTTDRTYAPILVRLAVKAYAAAPEARDVATVYEQAFESIVRSASAREYENYARLRSAAIEFALNTYWKHGERSGSVNGLAPETSGLLARLRRAGVLVNVSQGALGPVPGQRVRFFHDSMQSYFAAVGLSASPRADWLKVLIRAAGAAEFAKDRSDLFGYGGSELFCMCADILKGECSDMLASTLSQWAVEYDGALTRDAVAANLPPAVRERHDIAVNVFGMSAGRYIESVLADDRQDEPTRHLVVAALFAVVAPVAVSRSLSSVSTAAPALG